MEPKLRLSDQLSDKLLFGIRAAVRKLVEQSALQNRSLVVLVNEKHCEVPAKELLKNYKVSD